MKNSQKLLKQALQLHQSGQIQKAIDLYKKILPMEKGDAQLLFLIGTANIQIGQRSIAVEQLQQSLVYNPQNANAHYNLCNALIDLRRLDEALVNYDRALILKPDYAEAYNNRGNVLSDLNRLDGALASYDKALALNPVNVEAYNNRGNALCNLKRLDEALASYDKALTLKPSYAVGYNNRGNTFLSINRLEEALASYDSALTHNPYYVEAYNNRGSAFNNLMRLDNALANFNMALALNPGYADAYNNRGNTLKDLERLHEALASYDQALAFKPDLAEACYNRGNVLSGFKRLDEALASFDQALALKPDYAEAYNNRGNVLSGLKRLDEALASYGKALTLNPDYADAYNNRGNTLSKLNWLVDALANYDKALMLKPDLAEAFYNRGNALNDLKRPSEALASYDMALVNKPNYVEAYNNRGNVLRDIKRFEEALASYDKALTLDPDLEFLFGKYVHTKMRLCDWRSLDDNVRRLIEDVSRSRPVTTPMPLLGLIDSPELHLTAARVYVTTKHPKRNGPGAGKKRPTDGKIRIGYYSPDYREHPVSYLSAELFEVHDRARFEIYGFSFGDPANDNMRQRVSAAFDRFIDVNAMSDDEVVSLSRDIAIDIAVDLGGHTKDARTDIFAGRAAPIQVNYLGYAGSMGAEYIDYIIADRTVIPLEFQTHYTEKVVYLPHSYLVNDSKRKISDRVFRKRELGLPETGFVFCCFNNTYKILPATFDSWMRILNAVPGSVLWLLAENPIAEKNLRKEAEARGVEDHRIRFAQRIASNEDYLARLRAGDLMLDTIPYNAHATTSDALWAGLPILTCMGRSFASRVAASLLNAIDLPELITRTQEDYEARAIELSTNPEMLTIIKNKLARNRLKTPLFDSTLFAKHIEAAYAAMYARQQVGLAPDAIDIESSEQL